MKTTWILGLLLLASPSASAQPPQSPHGDLDADCSACHSSQAWADVRIPEDFDHNDFDFPLNGSHRDLECGQCHASPKFGEAPSECDACHSDVHEGELGRDCERCHTTTRFIDRGSQVRLHRFTRFPLTGSHITQDCDACHARSANGQLRWVNTPVACGECHMADFTTATEPDHVQGGFSDQCDACHSSSTWRAADFDHAATGFTLNGAHAQIDCSQCHTNGGFTGLDPDCYACHDGDYRGVASPDHVGGGFPTDCTQCHTTGTWKGADFDHATTGFALDGAHAQTDCSQCHTNGSFTGLDPDCYACHDRDYQATTDPNHISAGFPTSCLDCHTTSTWMGATFDHATTGFALDGAHAQTDCSQCHTNGSFTGLDPDCYACHDRDYQATTDPNHISAGFPTSCLDCHTTSTWMGAEFDHDGLFFPIYTGVHAGRWAECSECHTAPSNFSVFNCLGCHPHNDRAKVDADHSEVGNSYAYDSVACYDCHPRGRR